MQVSQLMANTCEIPCSIALAVLVEKSSILVFALEHAPGGQRAVIASVQRPVSLLVLASNTW